MSLTDANILFTQSPTEVLRNSSNTLGIDHFKLSEGETRYVVAAVQLAGNILVHEQVKNIDHELINIICNREGCSLCKHMSKAKHKYYSIVFDIIERKLYSISANYNSKNESLYSAIRKMVTTPRSTEVMWILQRLDIYNYALTSAPIPEESLLDEAKAATGKYLTEQPNSFEDTYLKLSNDEIEMMIPTVANKIKMFGRI